jgi:hypothetical protein
MAGSTGKRGWAVELGTTSTTHNYETEQRDELIGSTSTPSSVTTITSEFNIVDLFSIGASKEIEEIEATKPFVHQVRFHGPQGEIIRVWANIDDGAMKEVMSSSMFHKVKHRLGTTQPSTQLLRVANGVIVGSEAKWKGKVEINGVSSDVIFEVFDSGGKWDFLFGKTLLESFKAVHDYKTDEITLHGTEGRITTIQNSARTTTQQITPICVVAEEAPIHEDEDLAEVDVGALKNDTNLFTRLTLPHKPERVQELLRLVTIGDDLSKDEKQKVRDLISSFADIFALSVSEVKVVDNAVHRLDIPPETSFPMKVHQKPLTPPQRT